uniref:Glycoside hydrolase family 38 N-terminal domain-containing protein n=1 Tax=Timema monikensis TaxID=170555 RepID=A0A7R9HNI0_9NEOP|nr:unnamed protein product [Timema monikensis]
MTSVLSSGLSRWRQRSSGSGGCTNDKCSVFRFIQVYPGGDSVLLEVVVVLMTSVLYSGLSRWRQRSSGSGGCSNDKCSVFSFIQVYPGGDSVLLEVVVVGMTSVLYSGLSRWRQRSSGSGGCSNDKCSVFRFIQVETAFFWKWWLFIQVETAFFWKWWVEQDEDTRDLYRSLVNSGQIEMIGGGWSMNDEAATHYHSTIDNFAWGLRRLDEAFGACGRPRVGWQIDPFGHSRETASIMAQMGFDGLLFARLDYQDKEARVNTSTMEMLWEASANLGESCGQGTVRKQGGGNTLAPMFEGEKKSVMYSFYGSPAGFCYDVECNDEPIIDNVHSTEYNVDNRVKDFLSYVNDHASHYVTDNILIPMGGDFQYQDAHINYKNMDKLIRY